MGQIQNAVDKAEDINK